MTEVVLFDIALFWGIFTAWFIWRGENTLAGSAARGLVATVLAPVVVFVVIVGFLPFMLVFFARSYYVAWHEVRGREPVR